MFSIHHVAISVSNIKNSIEFYGLLNFKEVFHWKNEDASLQIVHLRLGDFLLEMFSFQKNEKLEAVEFEKDLHFIGVKHFALKVKSIEIAKDYFISNKVRENIEIIQGRTGLKYFFITDPDNINLEIVEDNRQLHVS